MIHVLRSGGADVMWARLESPRASYATPACRSRTTRASRRRQLPTNHGHAALPLATRVYQPDSSSKTPHPPLRAAVLRKSSDTRGEQPQPLHVLLEPLELRRRHDRTSASDGAKMGSSGRRASNGDRPEGSGSTIARGVAIWVFPVRAS